MKAYSAGLRAQVDRRAGAIAQLEVPGQKVGVQVGENDVADRQPVLLRERQVLLDVALRIDDDSGLVDCSSPTR